MTDKNKRPVDFTGPVLLIGIGVIVLLNNLGLLDWSFWDVLRLWPVLLVAAGLEIVIGRHSLTGSLVSALVVLGLILGAVWLSDAGLVQSAGAYESVAFPLDESVEAEVRFDFGVGDVAIDSMSDSQNLVEGSIFPGRRASLVTSHDGGTYAEVLLQAKGPAGGWVGNNNSGQWNVTLHESVLYDLLFDMGVGDLTLDLRDLQIDDVDVDSGIGQITVKLPAMGNYDLNLDGGIGEIIVEVPAGLGVQVYTDSGIVSRNIPPNWNRSGDTWTNAAFAGADNKARLNINLGIGTITVREVGE